MLVIGRHKGEAVVIGDNVIMTITQIRGGKVRLAFDAPNEIKIHRLETYEKIQVEKAKGQDNEK